MSSAQSNPPVPQIHKYGLNWPADQYDDLRIEMFFIRKGGYFTTSGHTLGKGLPFHYEQMRKLLWPHLDDHRWHRICRDTIIDSKVTVLMGPGSCVVGETRLLNPITRQSESIQSIAERGQRPVVMTAYGPVLAMPPFLKGQSELVKVTLASGKSFISTPSHLVLSERGFVAVASLRIGQYLLSYDEFQNCSIWASGRRWSYEDAQNLLRTTQGSQSDCPDDYRFCGAPLHPSSALSQGGAASPFGVPISDRSFGIRVQREHKPAHSLACRKKHHLSMLDACCPATHSLFSSQHHSFSKNFLHGGGWLKQTPQFWLETLPSQPYRARSVCASHTGLEPETPFEEYRVRADAVATIKPAGFGDFYDIQVPGAHHYFANGTIHHNSGKTHEASWAYLCEYLCFPHETLVLVSSTDMRGLRLRVWGEITDLWQQAKDRYPYLPGHLLDSRVAITTDALEDKEVDENRRVRDMRKGLVGIPTVQGNKNVGLGKWIGVKQKRVRLIADEAPLMGPSFLSAFSNLNKNVDFRAVIMGNPVDISDPLGMAAEPEDGWGAHMEPDKTAVWRTRFMGGRCVNLIGTDSPNFDEPGPAKYKYLISREKIAETLSFFPKDSPEYYSQCVGSMKISLMARRVITRKLCRDKNALEGLRWLGTERIRIASLDAAYGGDRCMFGWGEFGLDVDGKTLLAVNAPEVVPINVGGEEPEMQIARYVKHRCQDLNIEPQNFFHDSTGRGALGTALAQVWSAHCNPVEFGGKPTNRPVSLDMFITDPQTGVKRLKLANEHYYNFVTELWFAVRYLIESEQLRTLPEEVMDTGCKREWDYVPKGGIKVIQVEPKEEMKLRTRQSPDDFDQLAILVEGARRRGLQITKLAKETDSSTNGSWLDDESEQHDDVFRRALLTHAR